MALTQNQIDILKGLVEQELNALDKLKDQDNTFEKEIQDLELILENLNFESGGQG